VVDARNAIHNPINGPFNNPIRTAAFKRRRREEADTMLEEKCTHLMWRYQHVRQALRP
jgi:hypothetical protein